MDWQRNVLIAAMVAIFAVLFIRWNDFQDSRRPEASVANREAVIIPDIDSTGNARLGEQVDSTLNADLVPTLDKPSLDEPVPASTNSSAATRLVTITTDLLEVVIDTRGGDIVRASLLAHLSELKDDADPFLMLNRSQTYTYIAQSGLIGKSGTDTGGERPVFRATQENYRLEEGESEVRVPLQISQGESQITKEFVVRRGDYLIDVNYRVDNRGSESWRGHLFGQMLRDTYNPAQTGRVGLKPYLGAALSTSETNYKKIDFDDLDEEAFKAEREGGWVAMVQHYFVGAWIPDQGELNRYQLRKLAGKDLYAFGFTGPEWVVEPGQTGSTGAQFYVGPKDQKRLKEIAPYLDLTIDYGWLWWIAKPLFWGLQWLHGIFGNWGWAIIGLTVVVKSVFYPLSATSYRSMAKMRKLQPEMARLRELHGDDRAKLSQEVMGLYKKEKVNPMGGCFPMLIQMPVFIALYWALSESVELRHAPWILWITDLSVKDPHYVLPILNGICMFFLQSLQPTPPDPIQAKVMKIMPVAFAFFFIMFPSGLVLYWTVNSLLSIAQQWTITRKVEAE